MDYGPLVKDEIQAAETFLRALNQITPIAVAFWLKRAGEDEERRLHVVADQYADGDFLAAYGQAIRLDRQLKIPDFNIEWISFIRPNRPIARAAIELNEKYPDRTRHRFHNTMFGDTFAADAYVYPPFNPAPVAAH